MTAPLARLATALSRNYRLERELGAGGMATVYLAEDVKHRRKVAVKVLRPDLAAALGPERFLREVKIAANLQHPHILPLHDSGEADGFLYYVMPFVDGISLREKLVKDGELPIPDAVRILRDLADAMAYAHSQGVVHRDIKPDNIMLSGRHALVTDFGVAKAVSEATGAATLTTAGVALGTPAYMAPEQAAADPHVDHRADIYAFGVVAYELLTGQPPFTAPTPQALLSAQLTMTPQPVTAHRPSIPPALAGLVMKCLEKRPADRWQSADELIPQLEAVLTPSGGTTPTAMRAVPGVSGRGSRRLAGGAVVLAVLLGLGFWRFGRTGGGGAPPGLRAVAVVPFENLTGDQALDVVGRVASEDLSRSIAQTDSADVVSGNAVTAAIGEEGTSGTAGVADRVARATGADLIVLGSYSKSGDSLRMQVSVVDAKTGKVVRALDPTTGPVADPMVAIGALRERLLGAIVSGDLARKVTVASTPPKYSAYLEYYGGLREYVKNDMAASVPYFERAIAIDSTYVAAYRSLNSAYVIQGHFDEAERVMARLRRQRDRLASADRLAVDLQEADGIGDFPEALRLAQEHYRRTGDPFSSHLVGRWGMSLLNPRLALDALRVTDSLYVTGAFAPQLQLEAWAYHQLGDSRKELAVLDRGIVRMPRFAASFTGSKFRPYAARRDLAAARALADTVLTQRSDRGTTDGLRWVNMGAAEFEAHGDSAGGQQLNRLALDWARSNAPSTGSPAWERMAGTLWLFAGALDSAEAHFTRALPDTSRNAIGAVSSLAIIAARRNHGAWARAVSDSLAAHAPKRERDFGQTPYWRAAILAELGDREQAIRLLRTAPHRRMQLWHSDPPLRALRGYPPFDELITPRR